MSKHLVPQTQIELRTGRIIDVAEPRTIVRKSLNASPPAQWLTFTRLAGYYVKKPITIRSTNIVAYEPYNGEPNTG